MRLLAGKAWRWLGVSAVVAATVVVGVPAAAEAAAQARLSPSSWNAGSVYVGRTKSVTITLTNTGTTTLNIGNVSISEDIDFSGGGGACQGIRLRSGRSCTTSVTFRPSGSGARTATLYFMDAVQPVTLAKLPLRGNAVPPASVSPATTWNFGTIPVGFFAWQDFTLTNVTGRQLVFGEVVAYGDADFEVDPGDCWDAQLAAGGSCSIVVYFEPSYTPPDSGQRHTWVQFLDPVTGTALVELPIQGTATP